jgi:hypothetical protein
MNKDYIHRPLQVYSFFSWSLTAKSHLKDGL